MNAVATRTATSTSTRECALEVFNATTRRFRSTTIRGQLKHMDRNKPESGWRAACLAAALFAITLNFLQPLAHAAMMRSGAPTALWTVFCNSTAADPDGKTGSAPATAGAHECCLGLAHASPLAAPSPAFLLVSPVVVAVPFAEQLDSPTSAGIRDGPSQPRGPPSLA